MADARDPARDHLVLILAPTGRDMPLTCALLREHGAIASEPCESMLQLCEGVRQGAGAALIAEEALDARGARRLIELLAEQKPWSDLPLIVLTRSADSDDGPTLTTLRQRANVTVLERPVRIVTLLSAVQAALRARRRQYEVRDLLAETHNAVRQRDQFLAMLGHELRNPLSTITHSMGILEAACPTANPLAVEQRDVIRRQTEHLARLVDDLLDVSRITSGKIVLRRRTLDLRELSLRVAKTHQAAAAAQRQQLEIDTTCEAAMIHADPVRMEQVVSNLLTNAVKYTPAGGHIELSVNIEGPHVVLRVRDNGIGMPADLLPRVFELFTQAERAPDRSQGGLGIGLTLVKALVEMHEGEITAFSDGADKGSEFVVRLPHVESRSEQETAAVRKPVRSQPRRVLIVEDQPDARRALQVLLQIWGHQVETADDGFSGLELATSRRPEVALIDVGLPGIDGYEVARRIRAVHGDQIRLIALTGYGQPEDRERAYAAGFNLHLVKPVDREQLTAALGGDPAGEPS